MRRLFAFEENKKHYFGHSKYQAISAKKRFPLIFFKKIEENPPPGKIAGKCKIYLQKKKSNILP